MWKNLGGIFLKIVVIFNHDIKAINKKSIEIHKIKFYTKKEYHHE